MTTFTREQLQTLATTVFSGIPASIPDLAAFALAQMEEKEAAEAEIVNHESWLTTQQAATYAAEAERDEARRKLKERVAERNVECDRLQRYLNLAAQERDEARRELDLISQAVRDAYEILPEGAGDGGTVYAIETDEDARVTWPNHPGVLAAVHRAINRAKVAQ